MRFLEYSGYYEKINKNKYRFDSNTNIEISCAPLTIVPPIYDISFKKEFSYTKYGFEIERDFLNSLFFSKSHSIIQLKFLEKEIPSNSHLNQLKAQKLWIMLMLQELNRILISENHIQLDALLTICRDYYSLFKEIIT